MIEVKDLYKYYGERRAAGPLSFSIAKGEIVGLLGLNGAGKTTALRILACDLLPSSGSVRVDSFDVVDQPHEVRRRIGYLSDTPPLYGEMTVHEFLVFAARLRGLSKTEANSRAVEAQNLTKIDEVANAPIFSLSHGYKQRVGIAQAIVHKPRLILLDEPILGLDPVQIVEMRRLLRSLRGDFTVVLSSHNLKEISETCDRLLVIRDGLIVASGTEAELSDKLLHGFRFECTLRGDAEKAKQAAHGIDGIRQVELIEVEEAGQRVHVLRIDAQSDVRADLVRALVSRDLDVIGLSQGERELESVFIRLAGNEPDDVSNPSEKPTDPPESEDQKEESDA